MRSACGYQQRDPPTESDRVMAVDLLFVLNPILGWKTYARQLTCVLGQRPDVSAEVLVLRPPRWVGVLKHHDRNGKTQLLRRVDPIAAFHGWLGRNVRDKVQRLDVRAIHYGGHLPSAATAYSHPSIPFTVALDSTRFNMNSHHGKTLWSRRALEREADLLQRATRLYPMSQWAAASLTEDCGVLEDRYRVVPPSTDLREFGTPAPSRGRPKILFVGNNFLRKGGDRLHEWVTGPLGGTCELHIVSQDPRARVAGKNVVFHGWVDHAELIGRLMPTMDLFCLPTRSDMSPHVLVEAAAAGLATVASDLGGIPDLVLHGRTGFLVPHHDDEAFVARLRELVAAAELRRTMGAAAKELSLRNFNSFRNFNLLIDDLADLAD